MTTHAPKRARRAAVLVLTILVVVLWAIALGMLLTVVVLLIRVGAPADRTAVIAAGWFVTPAIPAAGATIALVSVRRSSRPQRN